MATPIKLSQITESQTNYNAGNRRFTSTFEAKAGRVRTAFLCHSHHDREQALRLSYFLASKGIILYIDWLDEALPATPSKRTAEKIQEKIRDSDIFLYLATRNSSESKWCPWEIGYGDCAKGKTHLLIIPTTEGTRTNGQEYLQLYKSIQLNNAGQIVEVDPERGESTFRL